jgi:predicted TPR repeat methyltransferase
VARALEHHRAGRLPEAEAAYRAVLEKDPDNPDANNLLGMIALDMGFADDAIGLFERAVAADPSTGAYHLNLGNALMAARRLREAETAYLEAIALRQGISAAPYNLGLLYIDLRETDKAVAAFRETLAIEPDHPRAQFLATALSGGHCDTAPQDYVAELFDHYAEHYEKHLRDVLQCRVPEGLREGVLQAADGEPSDWTILDLGCGSGRVGPLVKPFAERLVGSDLSPRILEKAHETGAYDELYVEDLRDTLERAGGEADLVVAADVFVYVGDLDAVFEACARALRPGGLFAFSTEALEGEGFRLAQNCRYAHSLDYIRALARRHGFGESLRNETVLRTQAHEPVLGHLFVLRRLGRDESATGSP